MAQNNRGRENPSRTERQVAEEVREQAADIKEMAAEKWEQLRDTAKKTGKQVQDYAEEKPWQMTAAGVLAGFILGALVFRRRD